VHEALDNTLESLDIGAPVSHDPLHLFPLEGGPSEEEALILLDEALEEGMLCVEELGEGGSVPELRVVNAGARPVLLLEGDELVGAKQNRVVNSSVLVAAGSELMLPVSCVERGRWSRSPRAFTGSAGSPHPSLRRIKARSVHESLQRHRGHTSDQSAVWQEVDRVAALHNAPSPTSALQDTRGRLSARLAAYEALADKLPARTRGVVVTIGARPLLVEVLAGPRSCSRICRKLLAGYALEALGHGRDDAPPDRLAVISFIRSMAAAPREQHPAVGKGTDVRFASENQAVQPARTAVRGPFHQRKLQKQSSAHAAPVSLDHRVFMLCHVRSPYHLNSAAPEAPVCCLDVNQATMPIAHSIDLTKAAAPEM
jgi:hypothetical protein